MKYEHIDNVTVSAKFAYEGEFRYRYRLDVVLNNADISGKTVCVVMQNPSYAGEDVADKSVQFMEKVVFQKGLEVFAGVRRLIVVNQFAFIQTNAFQGLPHEVGSLNNETIRNALVDADIVILGWGSSNRFEERKAFVLNLLGEMKKKVILQTRMHPSRGCYENFIQEYVIQ